MRPGLLLLLALLATPVSAQDYDQDIPVDEYFATAPLIVVASRAACHRFDVYVAANNAQRRRGLMFVRHLPPFSGMLFVYPRDGILSIWMRNTYIPLDIIFVRSDGRIATIYPDAKPMSETSMPASEPVRYVLEVNGGVAERLGIDENSRLLLDLLQDGDD